MRGTDLVHLWHPKSCNRDGTAKQYRHCLSSMMEYEGSKKQLGELLVAMGYTGDGDKPV